MLSENSGLGSIMYEAIKNKKDTISFTHQVFSRTVEFIPTNLKLFHENGSRNVISSLTSGHTHTSVAGAPTIRA